MSRTIPNYKFQITKLGLFIVLIPLLATGCNKTLSPDTTKYDKFRVGETVIDVEVENTEGAREAGLSGRSSLPQDQGMLFVFDTPDKQGFWMKDMQFPLDFIWIKSGRVVEITPNVPIEPGVAESELHDYRPAQPIDGMLEVNAGWASAHGIKVTDPAVLLLPGNRP